VGTSPEEGFVRFNFCWQFGPRSVAKPSDRYNQQQIGWSQLFVAMLPVIIYISFTCFSDC